MAKEHGVRGHGLAKHHLAFFLLWDTLYLAMDS